MKSSAIITSVIIFCMLASCAPPETVLLHEDTGEGETLSEEKLLEDVLLENALAVDILSEDIALPAPEHKLISPSSVWSVAADMTEFEPGFHKEPIGDKLFAYIYGVSFPAAFEDDEDTITREELCFLTLLYYDFDGNVQAGELICNAALADDFLAIFYELYLNQYPFERICLIEEFDGSDKLAMSSNNTTGFNYRKTASGNLSKHSLGLAIDINPFYNPYIIYDSEGNITRISPEGSDFYIDRAEDFPHKIDENDLCYRLFKEHGFIWGGDWIYEKDYMHFQKVP